jgi:hypothetical protein
MIVIRLRSGLGNQMFQYAFFLQMQQWYGKENVKLDIDTYHWKAHNGRELDKVFGIDLRKDAAPVSLSLQMADVGYSLKNRILRRLRGKKHQCYTFWRKLAYEDYRHLPDDIYLEGYWTEERYFYDVAGQVRSVFQFPEPKDDTNKKYLSQIENSCSVGIHVRRGDYKKKSNSFPMCPAGYYREAVDFIEIGNPGQEFLFFVFSDDIKWCKKNLSFLKNVQFIDHNVKTNSYKDMMLLAACKHQIMANSTFSWWAAWLNPNPDKIVIYPSSAKLTYASMPESWICIDI